ncbi:MAG: hypothetical protein NTU76_00350 [Candidatus Taylorbacteria bacterium]|nr:hypothetical protein [Candidatus Taylorbacteria bacterium]
MDISILSLIISVVSVTVAFLSYSHIKRNYQLTQTPIILPLISKIGDNTNVYILNEHSSGVAKDLSIIFKRGKLTKEIYKSDDLLIPKSSIEIKNIIENLDGCVFELKYKNLFNQEIIIFGTVSYLQDNSFDLQNLKLKIKGLIR